MRGERNFSGCDALVSLKEVDIILERELVPGRDAPEVLFWNQIMRCLFESQ